MTIQDGLGHAALEDTGDASPTPTTVGTELLARHLGGKAKQLFEDLLTALDHSREQEVPTCHASDVERRLHKGNPGIRCLL